jgi:hypothetical protein
VSYRWLRKIFWKVYRISRLVWGSGGGGGGQEVGEEWMMVG